MASTSAVSKRKTWTGLGIILVLAGIALVVGNLGLFAPKGLPHFIRTYWPCVILGIGISKLLPEKDRRRTEGFVFLGIGAFFQLLMLDWVPGGFASLWPVASIMFGLWIYFGGTSSDDRADRSAIDDEEFELDELFSSRNVTIASPVVRAGKITLTFARLTVHVGGQVETPRDLIISHDGWFSSLTIRVPEDWTIDNKVLALIGSVRDRSPGGSDKPASDHRIVLQGTLHFGRVEIRRPRKDAKRANRRAKATPVASGAVGPKP